MELQTIPNNSGLNNSRKGIQLTFKNISYTVENKKYKKQLKKQDKIRKQNSENSVVGNNNNDDEIGINYNGVSTYNISINNITIDTPVEKELKILNNVSGVIEQGELVALMGPSGSGKSTLLDILAKRKSTGKIDGEILVNGKEIGEYYKIFSSYVTQEDVLLQTSTVFETLKFYADLRLPCVSELEKIKRVESIIEEIGLTKRTHARIGGILPGGMLMKGLSGGEKRRVSIGCALVTNPSMVFLDEPTSGLDSVSALQIMKTLLNLTRKGTTVICSIHQPRQEIFQLFNKVMVIIKGKMIYSGTSITEYFESIGYPLPNNTNPADYFLDSAVEIGESSRYNDICQQWQNIWENELLNEIEHPPINFEKPKQSTMVYQYRVLLARTWKDFLRNQGNFIARIGTAIIVGLLFGVCFANLKENEKDIQKVLGVIFFLITGLNLTPFTVISLFLSGRTLFNSERASKIYHSFPYYLSLVSIEVFTLFWVALITSSICYLFAHLRWDASSFFFAMMVYFFVHASADFMVCTIANITGTSDMTFAYGSCLIVIYMLFAGFYVPVNVLPSSFGWLHYVNPLYYSFTSLVINQFENLPLECTMPEITINNVTTQIPCQFSNGNQVIAYYGLDDRTKGDAIAVVISWCTFFFFSSYLALHFLNKEKR